MPFLGQPPHKGGGRVPGNVKDVKKCALGNLTNLQLFNVYSVHLELLAPYIIKVQCIVISLTQKTASKSAKTLLKTLLKVGDNWEPIHSEESESQRTYKSSFVVVSSSFAVVQTPELI